MPGSSENRPFTDRELHIGADWVDDETSAAIVYLLHQIASRGAGEDPTLGSEGRSNTLSIAKDGNSTEGVVEVNTRDVTEGLSVLETLFELVRKKCPHKLLPTELWNLWESFKEALLDGNNQRERANELCLWLEADSSPDEGETVRRDLDANILIVDYERYDTIRCKGAANIYWYMYKNKNRPVHWEELVRLPYCKGRQDNIKKILGTLPPELRLHIKSMGRGGRIYEK